MVVLPKNKPFEKTIISAAVLLYLSSCDSSNANDGEIETLRSRVIELEAEIIINEANLARFDAVDFEAWNKKDIELFNQLHAEEVEVYEPNGNKQSGKQHTEWASYAFTTGQGYAKVKSHPVKVASNNWTAVTGINEIPQTDGTFKEDGRMTEEHLFFGQKMVTTPLFNYT